MSWPHVTTLGFKRESSAVRNTISQLHGPKISTFVPWQSIRTRLSSPTNCSWLNLPKTPLDLSHGNQQHDSHLKRRSYFHWFPISICHSGRSRSVRCYSFLGVPILTLFGPSRPFASRTFNHDSFGDHWSPSNKHHTLWHQGWDHDWIVCKFSLPRNLACLVFESSNTFLTYTWLCQTGQQHSPSFF